jgi:hypothetical protein
MIFFGLGWVFIENTDYANARGFVFVKQEAAHIL